MAMTRYGYGGVGAARLGWGGERASVARRETPAHSVQEPALQNSAARTVVPAGVREELSRVSAERDMLANRLGRLERLLADPEKGQNAILYYRLRAVWQFCHDDLVLLAQGSRSKFDVGEDLILKHPTVSREEVRARKALIADLDAAQGEEQGLRKRIKELRHDLFERERPFRPGERLALTAALKECEPRLAAVVTRCQELRRKVDEVEAEPQPAPPPAKVVTARRAINTLLIALAQHYYLLFRDDQISDMALHAAQTPAEDAYFGLAAECQEAQHKIRELLSWARAEQGRGEVLQRRAKYLRTRLRYDDEESAVPVKNSLSWMPVQVARQFDLLSVPDELLSVNVLAQDYWDLSKVLLP